MVNKSSHDMSNVEEILKDFYPYAQKRLKFDKPIVVNLVSDLDNAKDPFGKTAYYDPNNMHRTLFIDNRHPKDMLRSFSHELVHHSQNCKGKFDNITNLEPGYAQKDPHMRKMEAEAYLLGNGFLVRDYEDYIKTQTKEKPQMNEEKLREAIRNALTKVQQLQENEELEEKLEHSEEGCEEAHKGETHDERQQKERMGMKEEMQTPTEMARSSQNQEGTPVKEGKDRNPYTSQKNDMLFESLTKKWCK